MKSFASFSENLTAAQEKQQQSRQKRAAMVDAQRERMAARKKDIQQKSDDNRARYNPNTQHTDSTRHRFSTEEVVLENTYGGEGSGPGASSGSGDTGTKAEFNKRKSTGLGNLVKGAAKNAAQSIKNAGKNTAGSQQKRKPQPYRIKNKEATPNREKGGALAKRPTSDVVKTAAKAAASSAAQRKLSGKPARPMLGGAQRPDLLKGRKPTPQLPGAQERPTLPSSNVRRPVITGTPQRKALPQGR